MMSLRVPAVLLLALSAAQAAVPQERRVEVQLVRPKYGFMLDRQGRSYEDVRLQFRVEAGGVQAGEEIWLEIRDQTSDTLYWKASIPARVSGEVIVPKGTQFRSVHSSLSFSVRTAAGATTPLLGAQHLEQQYARPIVVEQVTPSAVRASDLPRRLRITGTGFTPESAVAVARLEPKSEFTIFAYLPAEYIDPHTIEVMPQAAWFERPARLMVIVHPEMPADRPSRTKYLPTPGRFGQVIAAPENAPVLRAIEPSSVPIRSDGMWVTLRGERYKPMCHAYLSDSGEPLTSNVTSDTEFRVLVPGGFFVTGYDVILRVQCPGGLTDVSAELPLRVTGGTIERRLALEGTFPHRLPRMTPGGPSAMDVRLFGSGFDRGAIAFAHIDDRPPVQLQTEWISPEELRVVLHREHWGELRMNFVGGLTPPPRR